MREVRFLKRRDRNRGIVNFVDIADISYEPAENGNISFEDAMGRIHGILPNGKVLVNIEVFRYVYESLGIGWVYAVTKFRPFEKALNVIYGIWAKWRLALTGRPPLEVIVAERKIKAACTDKSRCRLDDEVADVTGR